MLVKEYIVDPAKTMIS